MSATCPALQDHRKYPMILCCKIWPRYSKIEMWMWLAKFRSLLILLKKDKEISRCRWIQPFSKLQELKIMPCQGVGWCWRAMLRSQEKLRKVYNNPFMLWMYTKIRLWRQGFTMIASAHSYLYKYSHLNLNLISPSFGNNNKFNKLSMWFIICDLSMLIWVERKHRNSCSGLIHLSWMFDKMRHPWLNNLWRKLWIIIKLGFVLYNFSLYLSPFYLWW